MDPFSLLCDHLSSSFLGHLYLSWSQPCSSLCELIFDDHIIASLFVHIFVLIFLVLSHLSHLFLFVTLAVPTSLDLASLFASITRSSFSVHFLDHSITFSSRALYFSLSRSFSRSRALYISSRALYFHKLWLFSSQLGFRKFCRFHTAKGCRIEINPPNSGKF